MSDIDFVIVDDKLREEVPKVPRRSLSPLTQALLEGKTVFVREEKGGLNAYYEAMRKRGKKLTVHKFEADGKVGHLAWVIEDGKNGTTTNVSSK